MATNPYFTQYHTQRFSFIGSPQQRDGSYQKDQRFLNVYPELIKSPISDGKKYYLKKRPGVATNRTFGSTGTGRAIFYWASNTTYYTVIGNTLYANGTAILTISDGTTGPCGFCEFRTDTVDELFFCTGMSAWTITTSNSLTLVSGATNFPIPHIPQPIFLDAYIFLAASGTQTIHNSNLNDPTTWPADGFIDVEMFPDNLVGLSKSQNYLAAIGMGSVEWLYDNANSTGSPLQRNAPAVSQFGCPAPQTISQTEQELMLVGQTGNGGRTVWTLSGFQPSEIATAPVREALDAEGSSISSATGFTIQCAGHKWYVLNLKANSRTFVYDFEEQMWHEWSSGTGQAYFGYDYVADSGNGQPVLLSSNSTNTTVALSPTTYTDLGNVINCMVVTVKLDFDTIKRKRLYRLTLITDSPAGDNQGINMMVSWSDDDYNTFTTGVPLDVSAVYPTIMQLGLTRRRAFKFVYQQPYPLRMESFELDIIQEVRR